MGNKSGIQPIQGQVLVLPDVVDEMEGSVVIPAIAKDRIQMAQVKGTLVAIGADCFTYQDGTKWKDAPKVGARVLISKYAGQLAWVYHDIDNEDLEPIARRKPTEYRICTDDNIVAVITEEKKIQGHL